MLANKHTIDSLRQSLESPTPPTKRLLKKIERLTKVSDACKDLIQEQNAVIQTLRSSGGQRTHSLKK